MNIYLELLQSFLPDRDGYVYMWVLLLIAVVSIVLILERWLDIRSRTNVDAESFIEHIKTLVHTNKNDEAYRLCCSAGQRALPRIAGAGLRRAGESAEVILSAMEEESLHMIPALEKRVNYILMFGNISTLIGLMGTIYGLIISFAAVAQPSVDPVAKSSMLASGISAAMNTTLLGLIISVPCVFIFSVFRSRIDDSIAEIDRYVTSLLMVLLPGQSVRRDYRVSGRRIKEEIDTDPNITPMMNLMVVLIPLLLSSAEFVKIGAIELKLPESGQGGGGGGAEDRQDVRLNLGIVITKKGFDLYHYFKEGGGEKPGGEAQPQADRPAEIPLKDGTFDFEALNAALAKVKRQALREIVRTAHPDLPEGSTLPQVYNHFIKNDYNAVRMFQDHEDVKIVAEENIKYETVVKVMDAARGTQSPAGKVTMFPNVSLAGGIVQ